MGLFDSLKDTAKNLKEQTKEKMDAVKEERAAKEAERERVARELAAKLEAAARDKTDRILAGKASERTGVFEINSKESLIAFTQEYMKKLVLPASSLKTSKLKMLPYSNEKTSRRDALKKFEDLDESQIIFQLENVGSKEFICVTELYLYARLLLENENGVYYSIKIALSDITGFSFTVENDDDVISVNGEPLLYMSKSVRDTDVINLRHYFERLERSDLDISDTEIDAFIHEKIGDEAYAEAKKYMEEDELIIYFAWGVDSLTAKDFLMCTTRQFVLLDRELLGVAQNVKKFYLEDIISMATEQANAESLTVTLLNAALSLCNLTIHTAGTSLKIQTLSVTEAERVVEVYNKYKRLAREEAKKPIAVVQAAPAQADPLEQLEKLQKLKEAGIISQEEFDIKKADLLSKL
ncbi:MAG: SHOCT domain-containing protein [Clostridia bacterium]|nr:SHOCT domain-containing protein [Clostridia bacterium]